MNVSREQYDAIVSGWRHGQYRCLLPRRVRSRRSRHRILDILAYRLSRGSTRTVRLTQSEDSSYVPFVRATFENWRDLEAETGRDLLTTGSIHANLADADLFTDARRSVETHEVDHEMLIGMEVNEHFPGYDIRRPSSDLPT